MFEAALREVHPDYNRNKSVRGIRTEFLRELAPGVYASHNALCKRGRYYHGFCLTLHRELPSPYLHSPFIAGGRFDHNRSVNMAIQRDIGRHIILSDSHEFRRGCEQIIQRCTAVAEAVLLPHYCSVFQQSREALHALAQLIVSDAPIPDGREAIRRFGASIADLDCDMGRFSSLFEEQRDVPSDFLAAVLASKPELFQRLRDNNVFDPAWLT